MHIVNQKLQGGLEDGTDDFGVLGVLFKASADDSKVDQAADDALHKITTHLLSIKHKGAFVGSSTFIKFKNQNSNFPFSIFR